MRTICKNWTWIESRWILIRGRERREHTVAHRLYAAAELIALLDDCGFGKIQAYGALSAVPYDDKAERLVVRAVRSARG